MHFVKLSLLVLLFICLYGLWSKNEPKFQIVYFFLLFLTFFYTDLINTEYNEVGTNENNKSKTKTRNLHMQFTVFLHIYIWNNFTIARLTNKTIGLKGW